MNKEIRKFIIIYVGLTISVTYLQPGDNSWYWRRKFLLP